MIEGWFRRLGGAALGTAMATAAAASPAPADLLPGTFANAEQVAAARASGAAGPPWTGLRIAAVDVGFRAEPIDAFGAATAAAETWRIRETGDTVTLVAGACVRTFARVPAGLTIINRQGACAGRPGLTTATDRGLAMVAADGTVLELQRARRFACTLAPVGGAATVQPLYDAGGRLAVPAQSLRLVLSLRHVAWPIGDAPATLELAIAPEGDRAPLATATADAAATRIGVAVPGLAAMCRLASEPKMPG